MKRNRVIQFSLIVIALMLFFFTYYSGNKDKITSIDKNDSIEDESDLSKEISNVIENVNYRNYSKGTFFELNAALAVVKHDEPNLSHLQDVFVVIKLSDLRKIEIQSDKAVFDKISNDCEFFGNVEVIEQDNIITSDNLNLHMSKNLITAFNNVHFRNFTTRSFVLADKVEFDMITSIGKIFMNNSKDRVKVKYIN